MKEVIKYWIWQRNVKSIIKIKEKELFNHRLILPEIKEDDYDVYLKIRNEIIKEIHNLKQLLTSKP